MTIKRRTLFIVVGFIVVLAVVISFLMNRNDVVTSISPENFSVPADEIISGGPGQDGIPPIDNPKFITIEEAKAILAQDDLGIALTVKGDSRFYPYNILVWHEIVNDIFGRERFLVTYCPLCLSGIVFIPEVDGELVEFGTSGKLYQSNLVMYDRKTNSLWSQVLGESIAGEKVGTKLTAFPSDAIKFGNWSKNNPSGKVLSQDTGFSRNYNRDPYGDYHTGLGTFFPVKNSDDNRLPEKELVLGIVINGQPKAYLPSAVKERGEIEDTVAGKTIVARYVDDIDFIRLYEKNGDELTLLSPISVYWFSWAAVHPDTELFK